MGIKNVADLVLEKFGIGKKFRIRFRSDFRYCHTLCGMIPCLVPEIEGGYPERDGREEGEGLVLTYSISWIINFGNSYFNLNG